MQEVTEIRGTYQRPEPNEYQDCGCMLLLAAVFRRAHRDVEKGNKHQRWESRLFIEDEQCRDFALAFLPEDCTWRVVG